MNVNGVTMEKVETLEIVVQEGFYVSRVSSHLYPFILLQLYVFQEVLFHVKGLLIIRCRRTFYDFVYKVQYVYTLRSLKVLKHVRLTEINIKFKV